MDQIKQYGPMISGPIGTILTAKGEIDSANNADRLMRYRARQLERNAGQEIAASTMAAREEQRQSALIASRAIAVAAASGGGVVDPTVLRILQGIDAEGALASATRLYNGQEAARGMIEDANASRYEGQLYKRAGRKRAMGTLLNGANDIAATWGSPNDKPESVFKEGGSYRYDGGSAA